MLRYRLGVGQTSFGQLEELNMQVEKERGLGWVFEEPFPTFHKLLSSVVPGTVSPGSK